MKTASTKPETRNAGVSAQNSFSIRFAGIADAPAIRRCLQAAFEKYRDCYTPAAFAETVPRLEAIERRLQEMHLLVAVAGGMIVGALGAAARGDAGHLCGMAVVPGWHGRGVSAALLEAAEADLRRQGCRGVTLDTTEPLHRARRFYQNHGYAPSGRVSSFFGMPLIEYQKYFE